MVNQLQSDDARLHEPPAPETMGSRRLGGATVLLVLLAGLALGLAAAWLLTSDDSESDDPSAEMTETIDAWAAAISDQSVTAMVELYSDEAVWYDEALHDTFEGRFGVRRGWDVFADVETAEAELLAANAETAAMRWSMVGNFGWELTGISVLGFDGELIVEETVYYDCAQSPLWRSCENMTRT